MADEIKLFNTLGREKQELNPVTPGQLSFYQCGPTVYWIQQLGNLRAYVVADFIVRTLRYAGYKVTFVRNYTDVGHLTGDDDTGEDKMEKAVKREGIDPDVIAQKYIDLYEKDIAQMNVILPDYMVRATDHIPQMIQMIQNLLKKNIAYETDLAVYFDTSKAKEYFALSGQKAEELQQGMGHGDIKDDNKKNPLDFALWFFRAGSHKNALQYWESPFHSNLVERGVGFPGWHIECSAMAKEYLGETIDIHMGGRDLIPTHHTNEIAQSECANERKFVNYWLHNEMLLVDGRRMGKSEGNALTIDELVKKGYTGLDIRYFFLQAHYRSKQNFTYEALNAARSARQRLHERISSLPDGGAVDSHFKATFQNSLYDDFNTAGALAVVSDILKSDINDADKRATILDFDLVLGLKLDEETTDACDAPDNVQDLLDARAQARSEKDWTESDKLRDEIASLGYEVHDTPNGQTVTKK